MTLILGFVTLLITLLLINVVLYFPLWLLRAIHLPQWLLIGVGLVLFSWIFGDDQGDRSIH